MRADDNNLIAQRPVVSQPVLDEPVLDEVALLELALVMTRPGARRRASPSSEYTRVVELPGVRLLDRLDSTERGRLRRQAEDLADRGIRAVVRGVAGYPVAVRAAGNRPPILFYSGPIEILDRPGVGICGSRNASPAGLRAAALCGTLSARRGIASISGYARGVDMATHVAGLEAGGHTVLILPEGIDHFRIRRDGVRPAWDPTRALVLSQFAPTQPWTVHGAMTRNETIIGLSTVLVVIEAGERGGTLAAGRRALALGCRVLVLEFASDTPGNRPLIAAGAVAVRDDVELEEFMHDLEHVVDERNPGSAFDASQGTLHLI